MSLNVVVADDQMLTREGIVGVLRRARMHVVGQAGSLDEVLRVTERARPHVVVTDIRMPPDFADEGLQAARTIQESHPSIGVLILSQYVEHAYAGEIAASGRGGIGYLLKQRVAEPATLVDAIGRIAQGACVIDPEIGARLMGRARADDPLDQLSAREREVLGLMAEGRTNASIAAALFVTPRTVEAHTTRIFEKLGLAAAPDVHRRVTAVLAYLRDR